MNTTPEMIESGIDQVHRGDRGAPGGPHARARPRRRSEARPGLRPLGLDVWLLFARESATVHDPSFDLVVGTNVTWHSCSSSRAAASRLARRAGILGLRSPVRLGIEVDPQEALRAP